MQRTCPPKTRNVIMELWKAILERRSVRHFKPDPIPKEIIRDILQSARWAPSWGNTQPWEFYIVLGKALEQFREANQQSYIGDVSSSPEIAMPETWPDNLKRRYHRLGKAVLGAMSISRDDPLGRKNHYASMYSLFGAPCLILICVDKSLDTAYVLLDVGLVTQTICLLAHDLGLGTCILAASVRYPHLIRQFVPIPNRQAIVIGIAMGHPDRSHVLTSPKSSELYERIIANVTQTATVRRWCITFSSL